MPRSAEPSRSPGRGPVELARFAMVGAMTFVLDTTVFIALRSTILAGAPVVAKLVAVAVATAAGYGLNRCWSFTGRPRRPLPGQAVRYAGVSLAALGVNASPLLISRDLLGLAEPAVSPGAAELADLISAQVIGTAAAMGLRWWTFAHWVFAPPPSSPSPPSSLPPSPARPGMPTGSLP